MNGTPNANSVELRNRFRPFNKNTEPFPLLAYLIPLHLTEILPCSSVLLRKIFRISITVYGTLTELFPCIDCAKYGTVSVQTDADIRTVFRNYWWLLVPFIYGNLLKSSGRSAAGTFSVI